MDRRNFIERFAVGAALSVPMMASTGVSRAQASPATTMWANVKQFGAIGDGSTDDTAAINAALASLQRPSYERGGILYFPAGHYRCTSTLAITSWNAPQQEGSGLHNIIVRGDGPGCTILDFNNAVGAHGITFNRGAHFGVEDIEIVNAPGTGILIADPGGSNCALFSLRNLRIQFCHQHGIQIKNAYMGTLEDIWSTGNLGNGFEFDGYHTSIDARRCYATHHATGIGWVINGMTYSNFSSCGSDNNRIGYALSNVAGIHFSGCGAEANSTDAWLINANAATSAQSLPPQTLDVHGLVLTSCFTTGNNIAGAYASHLSVTAADQRTVELKLMGNVSLSAGGGTAPVALNANTGHIRIIDEMNRFEGSWAVSGDVIRHTPY